MLKTVPSSVVPPTPGVLLTRWTTSNPGASVLITPSLRMLCSRLCSPSVPRLKTVTQKIRKNRHALSSYSHSNLSLYGQIAKDHSAMGGLFLCIFLIGIIRKTWLIYALYRTFYYSRNLRDFDKSYKIRYSEKELV